MMRRLFLYAMFFPVLTTSVRAQIINAYGEVTSITGSTVLNLGTVNETYDTFEDGEYVIVMQMQGASITTTSSSSFGTITSIGSAGLYEVRTISSHTASSITLDSALTNTYNTASGSVQVISYPTYGGGGDYTTTGSMSAMNWDGTLGGVVAFNVSGNLYLAHDVSASGNGFNYGDKAGLDDADCPFTSYWIAATGDPKKADKGEAIAIPTASQVAARAKIANGGGGGCIHNGGGGGGGNYTGGGDGFYGTPGACLGGFLSGAGQGAVGLSTWISIDQIFMGGGGGGGQENNSKGSHGGDGGGIVIIEADSIFASCTGSVSITANGNDAPSNKNDGQGGGGGGGSIILFTEYISADATCPMTVSSNGGDGGSINHANPHGAGGGGGQGVIFVEAEETDLMPMDYLTFATENGDGGENCTTYADPDYDFAEDGDGLDDSGIFFGETPLLPVSFISFEAQLTADNLVNLQWITGSEINCDHYEVYRSYDGDQWHVVGHVPGQGTTNELTDYLWTDDNPNKNYNYYILKQVDQNGHGRNSNMVSVFISPDDSGELLLYPNPSDGSFLQIHCVADMTGGKVLLTDLQGRHLAVEVNLDTPHDLVLSTTGLSAGIYLLTLQTVKGELYSARMIIE